ncbi:CBS domain-containing protein [Favolaschia claudopus]|uniref:CBS domain-containing protein n=1 Tax=Favolaschia claudopus TaxID=2862362 RepID=A0AAW0AZG4_9AGAR
MATATLPAQTSHAFAEPAGENTGDLQLPPAFCVKSSETILRAIEQAYERDFSHIPVLDRQRRPLGYIDSDKVVDYMTKFKRVASQPYTLITPYTPLAELEEFLKHNIFAIVTDPSRKFVVALATPHDLETFVSRRGL